MPTRNEPATVDAMLYPSTTPETEIDYPETNGEEMGETTIHSKLLRYLIDCLELFFIRRNEVFTAANLNVYYEKGSPQKYYAPDVLVVFGISNDNRSSYKVWEEGVFPQVIIEIASENTYANDLGRKYADYNQLGVEEYYLLDPERIYLPAALMAYQRGNGERLLQVPTFDGRVHSPRLGLEIVDGGTTFRLFNPATNQFLLSPGELAARVAELEALLKEQSKA